MAEPSAAAVTYGPGYLYIAPLGSTEPTTVSSAWDAAWVKLGYTEAGSTFTVTPTITALSVAEEFYPVVNAVTGVTGSVAFVLSEMTKRNLSAAFNAGLVTPDGNVATFEPPTPGQEVRVMLGWDSQLTASNSTERMIFRRVIQGGAVSIQRQKSALSGIAVSFDLEAPGGGVAPWKWWGAGFHNQP